MCTAVVKKLNDLFAGLPMTIIGGLFLLASFVLPRIGVPEGAYLAWVCVVICGFPLLYLSVWRLIYNKGISKISSALLITIAMIAALLIGDLFAAGEVAFIMEIGAILEEKTTERARKGLKNLISMVPETAKLVVDGEEKIVPIGDVKKGDIIRIIPGETVPVDGIIVSGRTSVDQSTMTGESLPVDKDVGDSVYSGTINRFGSVDIEATKTGENSSLQKLVKMVEDADNNQAPTQRIADKWASWLVPIASLIAVAAYFVTNDIVRAVTVLVVFCPCALVLATPTAIIAAIGQATKHGVIIKSGEALEKMGSVNIVAFDKTGTLTFGTLEVSDIRSFGDISSDELLIIAASSEKRSEHPLGKAIVSKAASDGIKLRETSSFEMIAGMGVSASIDGTQYHLGNEKLMAAKGLTLGSDVSDYLMRSASEGKATILIADDNSIIGAISMSDVIRPDSRDMICELEEMDVRTVLLTGDRKETADYFAQKIGITEVRSKLLPEEKVSNIVSLKENGKVCMIGDGVNDAPALKTADVGVAMGAMGSDIAVDAADVALMTDDISKVPYLKWLSNSTVTTIKVAITISMCINFVAIVASVLGLLNPTTGAIVHNAGSCFVVLLAALLYDRKYPKDKKKLKGSGNNNSGDVSPTPQ
ncbi:MAG: cation-translocating P-type ATPase [Thermoplasmata archaeon]|nr:cation-translocating P-type ATPase [Thermoplasmata archaeon]